MTRAAMEAADRDARTSEIFSDIDARIAAAESAPIEEPLTEGSLSDEERALIEARLDTFFAAAVGGLDL